MKVVGKTCDNKPFAYYRDIIAACGENTDYPYYRTKPILIGAVLSGSTQCIDLKEKFDNYLQIPSLLKYLIISKETLYIRVYRRRTHWQLEPHYAEDPLMLKSVRNSCVPYLPQSSTKSGIKSTYFYATE